jgi:hypothetical protein
MYDVLMLDNFLKSVIFVWGVNFALVSRELENTHVLYILMIRIEIITNNTEKNNNEYVDLVS